jgi:predicted ATPase/class 3 adenylate cyclase
VSNTDLPVGTVTFLFTDIEGSTRLVQDLDAAWPGILARHDDIVTSSIASHGGTVVKTGGDSVFAVFETADQAVKAAVEGLRRLAGADWPRDHPVKVRMGLHTGVGSLGGSDYVGLDVHRAARIANSAHGGQIVVSEQTAVLVERSLPDGVVLRDLGKHRLKDLSDPETIFQVVVEDEPSEFPALRTLNAIPNNLPLLPTSFIGREAEISEAMTLLEKARVLTLTGPGGTGKTRLSLQVAAELADGFEDGVFFVGLSTVTDSNVLPSVILEVLGLSDTTGDETPGQWLVEAIQEKRLLMVLDNFEQLLAAAPLVADLVRASPFSKFIVTSRAPLRISGEQEMPVPPLGLPEEASLSTALASEGVRLFLERAMEVRPDFQMDESNVTTVVDLVGKLDGLPLAIELVTSRLRHLPLETILERLDSRMLSAGRVDLPERQQTIENAIAWSYDLLDDDHREVFARLSVFVGGARVEEIEQLLAGCQMEIDLLDGLAALADHSLVGSVSIGGTTRFRMLHVIREYARDRLEESGQAHETRLSHLEIYANFAEAVAPELLGVDRVRSLDLLEADHDNFRSALEFGLEDGQVDLVNRLSAALWRFWQARGHLYEAESRLEAAVAQEDGDLGLRAAALEALGGVHWWRGAMDKCERRYAEALEMHERLDDPSGLANAHYNYGLAVAGKNQDIEMLRRHMEAAMAIYEELGDHNGIGNVLWGLGQGLVFLGESDSALDLYHRAVDSYRKAGNQFGLSWALFELSEAHRRGGRIEEAWESLEGALEVFKGARDVSGFVLGSGVAAAIALALGDRARAYRLMGARNSLVQASGTDLAGYAINVYEGLEDETLGALTGANATAYQEGMSMGYDELVDYALAGPVD